MRFNTKTYELEGYVRMEQNLNTHFIIENEYGKIEFRIILKSRTTYVPIVKNSGITAYFYYNKTYNNKIIDCLGRELSYSIEPELFNSLTIDENTGNISGTVNVLPQYYNKYKIYCKNINGTDYGEYYFVVKFSDDTITCERDSGFNETLATTSGTLSIIPCFDGSDKNQTRICYLKEGKGIWSDIDDSECPKDISKVLIITFSSISGILIIIIIIILIIWLYKRNKGKESYNQLVEEKKVETNEIPV